MKKLGWSDGPAERQGLFIFFQNLYPPLRKRKEMDSTVAPRRGEQVFLVCMRLTKVQTQLDGRSLFFLVGDGRSREGDSSQTTASSPITGTMTRPKPNKDNFIYRRFWYWFPKSLDKMRKVLKSVTLISKSLLLYCMKIPFEKLKFYIIVNQNGDFKLSFDFWMSD